MVELLDQIERISSTDLAILLHGETGVGKEVLAREIHRRRASEQGRTGAFVIVDCTNLPSTFDESIPFRAAVNGTVFLDEIGDLALPLQSKLLRALQSPEVRVIGATQRDLESMRSARLFREDLYYRLCECVLEIPPLRDRGDDIQRLADAFLVEAGQGLTFSDDARAALAEHGWPGNVRELRAVIRTASTVRRGPGSLERFDLLATPRRFIESPEWLRFLDRKWDEAKDEFARCYWTGVWQRFHGDRHKIAEHTDVSHVWLRSRRKLYSLGDE